MRWIAERIAEQRLLWHLRTADTATLHILGRPAARSRPNAIMREQHEARRRSSSQSADPALAGADRCPAAVALVPGPNVLGYLFTFTVVGHFLVWRGAVHALHRVAWTIAPNPALTELRRAFSLDADARHRVIREVAHRLHMPRMARFVEQMATPT